MFWLPKSNFVHVFWLPIFLLQFEYGCQFSFYNLIAYFPITTWIQLVTHKIDYGEKLIATSPLLNNYLSSHYSPFQTQNSWLFTPPFKTTHGYHLSKIYRS